MVEKLLARASGLSRVAPGDVVYPTPDLVIIHDGFVENAFRQLDARGYGTIVNPERVIFVTDHEVAYGSQRAIERGRNIRGIAEAWSVGQFYDAGRGGHGHIFPIERGIVRPGMFLFCYDPHCTNFGAVGALALGVISEVTTVLATGTLWTQVPSSIRVTLSGALGPGTHARDVGFRLAHGLTNGEWGIRHDYRVIEFNGAGAEALDLPSRVALCNSITEIGVANVLFNVAPFEGEAVLGQGLLSDEDASYEGHIALDLSQQTPQVALPGSPDQAADIDSVVGTRIDHAFIGACGSGMYKDFADAAGIIRGHRIADGVRMFVVPGTSDTARRLSDDGLAQAFVEAGAIMLPPGCGPCAGGLMAPLGSDEVSISTAASNHAGRFGSADGQIYLGSPLTVAASALAGHLADPRSIVHQLKSPG